MRTPSIPTPRLWFTGLALAACQAAPATEEAQPLDPNLQDSPSLDPEPLAEAKILPDVQATPEEASFLLDSFEALVNPPEILDTSDESIALRTLRRYFQADQDATQFTHAEALESFATMEAAGLQDDILTQPEFRSTYNQRRMAVPGDERRDVQDLMRGRDPWQSLTVVLDTNLDGTISLPELRDFLEEEL